MCACAGMAIGYSYLIATRWMHSWVGVVVVRAEEYLKGNSGCETHRGALIITLSAGLVAAVHVNPSLQFMPARQPSDDGSCEW